MTTKHPPSRMDTFSETTKAILQKVPDLSQLRYLGQEGDSEEDVVRVIEEVSHRWKELGDCLGFSHGKIAAVDLDHRTCEAACRRIFELWLQGATHHPVNWDTLINSLHKIDPNFNKLCDKRICVLTALYA